jgi:hypothetical protein
MLFLSFVPPACSIRCARLTVAGKGVIGRERRVRALSACDAAVGQGFDGKGNEGRRFGYVVIVGSRLGRPGMVLAYARHVFSLFADRFCLRCAVV